MKSITVRIDLYDWKVTVWKIGHKTKARSVKKLLAKKLDYPLGELRQLDAQVGHYTDCDYHYYNTDNGESVVIIYPTTSYLASQIYPRFYRYNKNTDEPNTNTISATT